MPEFARADLVCLFWPVVGTSTSSTLKLNSSYVPRALFCWVQLSNIPFGLRLVLNMIIESICTRFEVSHTLYLVWYSFCKYGLLAKCDVKMAGYWTFFFFACLWTETKLGSINSQKKNKANIQPSWPNKIGQWRIYYTAFGKIFLAGYSGLSRASKMATSCPLR